MSPVQASFHLNDKSSSAEYRETSDEISAVSSLEQLNTIVANIPT
jgi:hypothetical protein